MTLEQETDLNDALYRDAAQPIEARVADLLGRMSVEEKVAQLGSAWSYQVLDGTALDLKEARALLGNGLGQITRIGGATNLSPAEGAKLVNEIQHWLAENTRLGIPAIIHEECCAGYMARDATIFPQIIGLASTWEPALADGMAAVVRRQMRAAGAQQGLSPVLDVARDARWGRVEETFGEDPALITAMGVAFVRGLQGDNWDEGVVATAKHFVGYGVTEGGMNWAPAHIGPRELRDVFLLPFEAAVKEANLQSVMHAYHELDGEPCAASTELLTDTLIGEWGFDGVVVSDYFGVEQLRSFHFVAEDKGHAAALALGAGLDVELPGADCYGRPLLQAVEKGLVDEALLDRSVARVLRHKFMLGLFEHPYVDAEKTAAAFDSPEQRALAQEIAGKSLVLLKNEDDLLPLPKDLGRIAVIGPNADTIRNLLGDYAYPCHIKTLMEMMQEDKNVFNQPATSAALPVDNYPPMKSILAGIREAVSAETTIDYAKGCEVMGSDTSGFAAAVAVAEAADVAVLVMGGKSGLTDSCTSGESRDRHEINLPGVQQQLVEAVAATGTPVVVVLINGRPLSIPWIAEHVPAILEAWLPGEEGSTAVAGALFGDVNPGGKLPISFPRDAGQIPVFYAHKPSGGKSTWKETYVNLSNKPLYPFGYGLSYTSFALENLRLSRAEMGAGENMEISLEVTNTGARAGDEVVQLYVRDRVSALTRPVQELKGFCRVALQPGETRTVTFTLAANQLGYHDRALRYVLEPGAFDVLVGTSAADIALKGAFAISGELQDVTAEKVFRSTAVIS
jgi:beta-glucosidase